MVGNFPSLTITLKFMKTAYPLSASGAEAHRQGLQQNVKFWPAEDTVKLHEVARSILVYIFSIADTEKVMESSKLSLKAIHIIAIALRGLLRLRLGLDLSSLEKSALAPISDQRNAEDTSGIAFMMDKVAKSGAANESYKTLRKESVLGLCIRS